MPIKLNDFNLDYEQAVIDIDKIKLSPFQVRKFSSEEKDKELARSILKDGLIQAIVVRPNNGHFESIAGGRRVEAIRKYTDIKAIPAQFFYFDI
jgi:ParB family chromosome partitioning protein